MFSSLLINYPTWRSLPLRDFLVNHEVQLGAAGEREGAKMGRRVSMRIG